MAAQTGGYNCKWIDNPSDDLRCQICKLVAREPQQHGGDDGCGQIFCNSCITVHQKTNNICPNSLCAEQLKSLFLDKKSVRHINALKVKCNNMDNGCKWDGGVLGKLDTHLNTCDYALIPCDNKCTKNGSKVQILRKDKKDHLTNHCQKRQYQCPHCKEMGECQERTSTHLKTCQQIRVSCPNSSHAILVGIH